MPVKREIKPHRMVRAVRLWKNGAFTYYLLYSDGRNEPVTKRIAEQYERAYQQQVETVVELP